jgi:hypothetical protein
VFQVGEDLNDLARILGGESVDQGLADFFAEEVIERSHEGGVDNVRVLEIFVGELVDLVEKVADVDAT